MKKWLCVCFLLLTPLAAFAQLTCTVREITRIPDKVFVYCHGVRDHEITMAEYLAQGEEGADIRQLCPDRTDTALARIESQWDTLSGYPELCDVRQNGLDTLSLAVTTDVGDTVINTRDSTVSRDGEDRLSVTRPPRGLTLTDGQLTIDRGQVRTDRFLWPSVREAHAAVAYQADTASEITSLSFGTTFSHTISAGSNRLLVIQNSYRCTNGGLCPTDQTVTYDSVPATLHSTNQLDDENGAKQWRLINSNVGTANVVLTITGNATRYVIGAVNFTGVDQATPLGTAVLANAVSALTVTCGSVTVPTNGMAVAVAGKNSTVEAVTTTVGDEQYNVGTGASNNNMKGMGATRTTTGNFTWTHATTNRAYRAICTPVNAAADSAVNLGSRIIRMLRR